MKHGPPGLVERDELAVDHCFIRERRESLRDGGYRVLKSLLFRDRRCNSPIVLVARAPWPSYFSSYAQFAPSGNVRAGKSNIGSVKVALIFCEGTLVV